MHIKFAGLPVIDQDAALKFYTEVVGLTAAADIDMGPMRFLTVCGDEGFEGGQVVLEATAISPPKAAYQQAMHASGTPILSLNTRDLAGDYQRLTAKGVAFRGEPQDLGPIISVIFDDTCGNLIHLVQAKNGM